MLQFDAREHHLVQEFYQLKPRQTEIQKAKFIWKATTDEQAMRYEIALFNTYLSKQTLPESTTSQNILFPQINQLLTQTIFQNQNISTNEITKQALAKAEQLAITYESLAYNQISELEKTRFEIDCDLDYHINVWIDLNDDGKFDESENRIHRRSRIDSETPRHGYNLQILIPLIDGINTRVGPHRMRLSLMRSEVYQRKCGNTDYSEIREYTVNIIPRKTCAELDYLNQLKTEADPEVIVDFTIDQSHLAVKLFNNKVYVLKIQLYCVKPWNDENSYRQDLFSVETNCNIAHYLDVWIDLNNDATFDQSKELLFNDNQRNVGYINGDYDLNIAIPQTNGENRIVEPHIMRILLTREPNNRKPCYSDGYGEARDYTVHILRHPHH
ncbi:unnamed protein product [Rotaria magnacalcarata]|uniref:GEVED domain-containing protein n=2 Tax=Rotaria magnacalcarata TaxID=392030 RepID=A0A815D8W6_9BILA|nr:unnamed protein product [Rotaria magnacalcarata]CAF1681625.1 unnamed protein product [Rotaria magnacalcarata]